MGGFQYWGGGGVGNLWYWQIIGGAIGSTSHFQNYWGLAWPLQLHPCSYAYVTCTCILWNQSWKSVHSLYIVLIAQPLIHNTTLYLHVPSSCGHPIFPISDILFIKKYSEMGHHYYRIVSSCEGLLYRYGVINAVSLNFYWYFISYSKIIRNFTVEYFCMKNNLDYIWFLTVL